MERRYTMKMWLNGCFDILHHGHFKLIQYAASFGGEVIIGIDSDERVKQMKGEGRPFHSENERAFNLKQIKGVDTVVIFNSDEMLRELLERYKPDKFIIGSDYLGKEIIGQEFAKQIVIFDRLDKFSTTDILNYGNNDNR
jgi:D-beta-D-heptose 7-phosphate kinase/D-beta-D-heptose 1-phosphate adenosyltransferase